MNRQLLRIAWTAVVTVLAVVLISVTAERSIATVGAVLLTLLLPGWAVWLAIDPFGTLITRAERVFWSVATSIVVVIAGGLILDKVSALNRVSWVVGVSCFMVVVLAIAGVRSLRSKGVAAESPTAVPRDDVSAEVQSSVTSESNHGRVNISVGGVVVIFVALSLVVGAIAISQHSVSSSSPQFLEMWMVPTPLDAGSAARFATVGVENSSNSPVDVIVKVFEGDTRVYLQTLISLAPGHSWIHRFERVATERLEATLSYMSEPTRTIRTVNLNGSVVVSGTRRQGLATPRKS